MQNLIAKNKKCLVIGYGISGKSIANFLKKKNITVTVTDDKEIIENPDNHTVQKIDKISILNYDFVVPSPGIYTKNKPHPIISSAREHGVPILSDLDIFMHFCTSKCVIGITGTNGKSTTTALVNHILQKCELSAEMGGNIGKHFFDIPTAEYTTLELSSYQLEQMQTSCISIGAIINITPDHLERHGTMENYIEAKLKITHANYLAINAEDVILRQKIPDSNKIIWFSNVQILKKGISVVNESVYYNSTPIAPLSTSLIGQHNRENIAAALAMVVATKARTIEKALIHVASFKSISHRLELIRTIGKIKFFNDSKATNANSTEKALQCFPKNIILIAGGVAKHDGINVLEKLYHKIIKVFLIGEAAERFAIELSDKLPYKNCQTMQNAIRDAYRFAIQESKNHPQEEYVILLSPLCASFDQYKNFEHRGAEFTSLVENL